MKFLSRNLLFAVALLCTTFPIHAAGISDYTENEIVDHLLRARAFTAPTTLCAGLLTAAPDDADTGATVTEAAYTNYARAQLDPLFSNWKGTGDEVTAVDSSGTTGVSTNNVIMTFGTAAGSGPTSVTHVGLFDSCTTGAGNMLFYAALTAGKTINDGDPAPTFPIDALAITPTD